MHYLVTVLQIIPIITISADSKIYQLLAKVSEHDAETVGGI